MFGIFSIQAVRKVLAGQRGGILVFTAATVFVLTGMAALALDVGNLYLNRFQLVNAADAAALAGAQELPIRPQDAVAKAYDYAAFNKKTGTAADVVQPVLSESDTVITVTIRRNVPLFFARIWGLRASAVEATAAAQVRNFSGGTGIVPFGIEKQELVYGQTYTLKLGGGDGYNGNFQALALGATGANNYRDNVKYGYTGNINIGDWIPTETGNMSGPTAAGVSYRIGLDPSATFSTIAEGSGRIITVPVIDSLLVSGRTDVLVVGFAAFFLEGSGGGGNDAYVYGKFREMVIPGNSSNSGNYYGLMSASLIR